ncbi:hypothetical protein HZS_7428 [Henneguya salminicola]|nr:hypothetical protein HZS_7428 [Henneguya salminicola]
MENQINNTFLEETITNNTQNTHIFSTNIPDGSSASLYQNIIVHLEPRPQHPYFESFGNWTGQNLNSIESSASTFDPMRSNAAILFENRWMNSHRLENIIPQTVESNAPLGPASNNSPVSSTPLLMQMYAHDRLPNMEDQLSLTEALTLNNYFNTFYSPRIGLSDHNLSESDMNKNLMDINQFLLLNSTEPIIEFSIKHIYDSLWLGCIRVVRSIVDLYPQLTNYLNSSYSRLINFTQHSDNIELIEESIGVIHVFVRTSPKKMIRKYSDIFLQKRTILKIYIECLSRLSSPKLKYLKICAPIIIDRFSVFFKLLYQDINDIEIVKNAAICLHKILKLLITQKKKISKIFTKSCVEKLCDMYIVHFLPSHHQTLILQILSTLCSIFPSISKFDQNNSLKLPISIDVADIQVPEMAELATLLSNFYPPLVTKSYFYFYHTLIESYCADINYIDLGLNNYSHNFYAWEYCCDGKWNRYQPKMSDKIETAYQERRSPFQVRVADFTSLIEFETMIHMTSLRQPRGSVRRIVYYKNGENLISTDDPRLYMLNPVSLYATAFIVSLISAISKVDLDSNLAHKCLIVLIKIVHYSESSFIFKLVQTTSLCREIELFLRSSSLTIVASAVLLVKIFHEKLCLQISEILHDEGVYHSIIDISEHFYPPKPNNENEKSEYSNRMSSVLPFTMEKKKKLTYIGEKLDVLLNRTRYILRKGFWRSFGKDINTGGINTGQILIQRPYNSDFTNLHSIAIVRFLEKNIIVTINSFAEILKKRILVELTDETPNFLTLNHKWNAFENMNVLNDESLSEIAKLFLPENIKNMTPYKIAKSKIVELIAKYLSDKKNFNKTLKTFIQHFICGYEKNPQASPFYGLIQAIHIYISYIEKIPCPCITRMPTQTLRDNFETLESKINFALRYTCVVSFKRHPLCNDLFDIDAQQIDLHPLRTIANIETFVLNMIEEKQKENMKTDTVSKIRDTKYFPKYTRQCLSACCRLLNSRPSQENNNIELLLNGYPLAKNLTLIQALITRFRSDPNVKDRVITEPCTLPNIYFGSSIIIYYRKPISSNKLYEMASSNFESFDIHYKKITRIKKLLKANKHYLAFDSALYSAIKFLSILHYINFSWGLIINRINWNPFLCRSCFKNFNFSIKLGLLVSDTFMSLVSAFPQWVIILTEICPFLFEFSARKKLFHSLRYGIERKIAEILKHDSSIELPTHITISYQIKKKEIIIDRTKIYEETIEILKDPKLIKSILSITYKDEHGLGLGPTAEFFSIVSREIIKHHSDLWNISNEDYHSISNDLFPAPIYNDNFSDDKSDYKSYFTLLGQFIGRALLERCQCDLSFSNLFYMHLLDIESETSLWSISNTDPVLYTSFLYLIECKKNKNEETIKSMELTFTWCDKSGNIIELCPSGLKKNVDLSNIDEYIKLILDKVYGRNLKRCFQWIQEGINTYIPEFIHKSLFFPEELNLVISGEHYSQWCTKDMEKYFDIKQLYTKSTPIILNLFKVLSEFDHHQQKLFLLFSTSKARLPPGGFSQLSPSLSIVPYFSNLQDKNSDDYLPSASTCIHMIKLPQYSTIKILRAKLLFAMTEGQEAFLLS